MTTRSLGAWLTAGLLALPAGALGEDIDLYVGAPPVATDLPNVLILLDNTANWNTAFTNEIAALVSTVNGLPVDKFRVGLMLFTETGGGNSGEDGGYVRAAVRPMNAANKAKYMALLNSLEKIDDKSNGGKLGKTMTDAHRYYAGLAPYTGNNKVKTDYTGNATGTAQSNAIYALPGNALPSKAGSPYVSPVQPDSCAKNFIIYISNGAAQDNNADTTAATTQLANAGGNTTTIPLSPSGSQDNVGDEWARFLRQSSLGVVTYTVDVDKVTTGQGPGWTAILKSMASVSNGKYFDVGSGGGGAQISDALKKIFSEIQAVNSVFASVSLPVSVNTQGTYLNQVYVGMFRPEANALPRWAGNLKQYKLGYVNNILRLQDADSSGAINNQTGFITECARSFWTPSSTDSYWAFEPKGACLAVANSQASNYPDGNVVEKGAQAHKLRASTTRTVKTCSPTFASCTTLTNFDTANTAITQALLGASSSSDRDELINWARGQDLGDENLNAATSTEMRPSVHADVLHSRPVAINFGTDASPQVVVFYGGNDGMLRAVNGNRTANIGSVPPGNELWAFVAPEFYGNIKRIRDNTTPINYFGHTFGVAAQPKPTGMDGPVTAVRSGASTWIYAIMRRGGRILYAFDVSAPANPSLRWKKGCPNAGDDVGCSAGFTGIGQTWSAPKSLKASGYGSGASPMLIMGGGYDPCEDADPQTCTAANKGNKVYVLDADSGVLLKTLDTDRGVVADLFVVPDSVTDLAKHAYAVDLGGNIYRIGIGSNAPADWTITKIAALGCATPATCAPNRKFMFHPDVLEEGGVYTLLIGSGDREKPLLGFSSASGVANHFFMVKDKPADPDWLSSEAATCGSSVICRNSLLAITTASTPSQADLDAKKGWYLGLGSTEQVVTSAITVFGVTTFSTHRPAVAGPGLCGTNLGTTQVYNVKYANAASANGTDARSQTVSGGGLPPSPVAGMVTLDDGTTVPFVIGASPESPLEGSPAIVPGTTSQPKSRVYWYIQK